MEAKQTLAVVTLTVKTRDLFCHQLKEILEEQVNVEGYAIEDGVGDRVKADLVLTTEYCKSEIDKYIAADTDFIVIRRSLQLSSLDKLINIPEGTRALLVCSTRESTNDTINFLRAVGINHIDFIPYQPGDRVPPVDLAIITGLTKDVPSNLRVIDISNRQIGISTIIQALIKMNLINKNADLIIANYVKRLVDLSKRLNSEVVEANKINKMLQIVINHVSDGIIYINEDQRIKIFNKMARDIFDIKNKAIVESKISGEIFNTDFNRIFKTGDMVLNQIQNIGKDKKVVTNILPVKDKEKNIGVLAICKDITEIEKLEETLRSKLKESGHIAKYQFNNIIGESRAVTQAKEKARNLAKSESTVLIQGETGTGKELFAQAVHNSSNRKHGPFIAINCATVPRDLFESELFGYVEGAFTGARKGGKPGVFEQAHKGTIFLDEIGDIPNDIQTKLLRVLQEKEVMRIGATKIIPVDIRVIAATNKNLEELVKKGEFREDLYYRLNVLPLRLPSLKERKEDLIPLIEFFLKQFGKEGLQLTDEAMSRLYNYDWPGNIRQLRNCIECLSQVCEQTAAVQDLPDYLTFNNSQKDSSKDSFDLIDKLNNPGSSKEYLYILEELYLARQMDINIGRRRIAENSKLNNINLNSQMVRSRLKRLEELGLVDIGRGRQGTTITDKGIRLLKNCRS